MGDRPCGRGSSSRTTRRALPARCRAPDPWRGSFRPRFLLKYRQRGYQDDAHDERERPERPERPRRDPDLPGGRLSEPQRVIRSLRCHHCGHFLPFELDARGDVIPIPRDAACTHCSTAVHACRNCVNFDPLAHRECRKPVKITYRKNVANDCDLFEPKLTAEMTRDSSRPEGGAVASATAPAPRTQSDARKAFEDLFK